MKKPGPSIEMTQYSKVKEESAHGGFFSIEDEDADVETAQQDTTLIAPEPVGRKVEGPQPGEITSVFSLWNTLTFAWMHDLLKTGNTKPLTIDDLYVLPEPDRADSIYRRFKKGWATQLREAEKPSLTWAFAHTFGRPFFAAAVLKFVHDSCLFAGPLLLNNIIKFLSDPDQPLSLGLYYVLGLFLANFFMSLCLRQYFWWCYRVGMNLRSAVVSAVYNKSLVISTAAMSRKTTGEISNLMSVDSSRLQDLTPYLHALWYSIFQIILALIFLWRQLGVSCLAGMLVIILGIPLTSRVSAYMKTLQKELSKIRDERIKLTNEVLAGMKVIKLQAWEAEFEQRILDVRAQEQAVFRRYTLSQALSGALFTTIPLAVAIVTFFAYIALGNTLDVATALTSLALFDLLRFPLFMLPQVLNNVVEAKVSVDRVQSFLLESERCPVPAYPLKHRGALLHHATLVYEGALIKRFQAGLLADAAVAPGQCAEPGSQVRTSPRSQGVLYFLRSLIPCGERRSTASPAVTNPLSASPASPASPASRASSSASSSTPSASIEGLSEDRKQVMIKEALLREAEERLTELESELLALKGDGGEQSLETQDELLRQLDAEQHAAHLALNAEDRLLTLSRVSLHAKSGDLVCIVGQVGSGKTSILQSLLGNLMLCHGTAALLGRVAYTAQLPFITNNTLRENILYGENWDARRYEETLDMCALRPDLLVLPAGDQTEIGERGINLSGGQKARVGLARAVYSDADIYLLDDPLSAVDAHVGLHLFDYCVAELVRRNKCVILVTNALHYIQRVPGSHVVVLRDGNVVETGLCEELAQRPQGAFAEMMSAMQDTFSSSLLGQTTPTEGSTELSPVEGEDSKGEKEGRRKEKDKTRSAVHPAPASPTPPPSAPSAASAGKLVQAEDREVGDVSMQIYGQWAAAAGGLLIGLLIIFNFYAGEAVSVSASWWLSYWSEQQTHSRGSSWYYLGIYALINLFVVLTALYKEVFVRLRSLQAGRTLFQDLVQSVLYAPMSFFDTTPLGRVINRFSKDIYTIDEQIPQTVRSYLSTVAKVTGVLLYICIVTPLFLLALVPIAVFYVLAQRYYIRTSRELTRIENITRSPIYAMFSETLDGLSTIRAYAMESRLSARNAHLLDENQRAYFLNFSANCWLAVRLEFVGTLIVTMSALLAVLAREYQDTRTAPVDPSQDSTAAFAGLAGLSISLALSVTQSLNWTVRMASDMESQMVSVERVKAYTSMPREAAHHLPTDPSSSSSASFSSSVAGGNRLWPPEGQIAFEDVSMRYRSGLPRVLNGLTLSVASRAKVGIVGRTGAGKSSLLTALLRLVELESGRILIDGTDISTLGLHVLRSAMAVIPQDPVLFSGTIRSNLDPFHKYTDADMWESLRRCLLGSAVTSLDDVVQENGSNYSVGQRQLLCIARALLAKAKIIIMDEATAAVDVETDAMIQKTIRTEFAHATCLTVAHRLNTILDSDMVLVMDQGRCAEYGTPTDLLADDQSLFFALVSNWESTHT